MALDLIVERESHFDESKFLLDLASKGIVRLIISSASIVTLIYLVFKSKKVSDPTQKLIEFIDSCSCVVTYKPTVLVALNSPFRDKEDAFQYYTALTVGADYFLTRDLKDFKLKIPLLPVLSPVEFQLEATKYS